MTVEQLLPLVLLLPLIGALVNGAFGKKLPKIVSGSLATILVAISFFIALSIFLNLDSAVEVKLFSFISLPDLKLDAKLLADNLSMWMTLIVTGVGALIHLFSMGYMSDDEGYSKFFAYLNLFIFSMLVLVLGSNYFLLYFGWEGVGVCSYLLIGYYYSDEQKGLLNGLAGRKSFIMNRVGDLALMVAMFMLLIQFGTLDYQELAQIVTAEDFINPAWIMFGITLLLFIGATGKSAQIPLFTWLPDAMAGPTPVSALIHAATMVTAGVFLTVRSNFLFEYASATQDIMLYVGLATSIVAAFIAMRQNDIKKVLAYSTISQLGLMFVALGLGAYTAAIFHVTTHAFFKALLFLGSGSVIHGMSGEQDIRKMGGLKKFMPTTHWTFLVGTLAITGFPLLSGFFSKDEISGFAFQSGIPLYLLLMFSIVLTAIYMFRMYFLTFHREFRGTEEQKHHLHESPLSMTIPLMILAGLSIIGGVINLPGIFLKKQGHYLDRLFEHNVAGMNVVHTEHLAESTIMILMVVASLVCIVTLAIAYNVYVKKKSMPKDEKDLTGWEKLSANKLYVDEFYNFLFVRPIEWLSENGYRYFELIIIDGLFLSVAKGFGTVGDVVKKWQSGQVNWYVLWMVSGVAGLIIYFIVKI